MIIDVSCDRGGGIETCVPTTIENPVYYVEGVLHYAVDHTPALFYKTFTYNNSEIIAPYIDMLMQDSPNQVLLDSLIIDKGEIIDIRIKEFQGRE
jgi:N5-(carboxyethyl)ornithine synthase